MLQFNKSIDYGDSGAPMWLQGSGKAVGLISTIYRQAAPLVTPHRFPDNPYDGYPPAEPAQMPGILNAPGMGDGLYLVKAK
jgi:hypothetical protein